MKIAVTTLASLRTTETAIVRAQTAPQTAAPLPAILSHTTFLDNADDEENADCLRTYSAFYDGINNLHRFTLVCDPADISFIVELHYEIDLGASVFSDSGRSPASSAPCSSSHAPTLWSGRSPNAPTTPCGRTATKKTSGRHCRPRLLTTHSTGR
jgi:hypothetical protein